FFGELVGFEILVESPCHRRAQAGKVGATVALRNVVREALHRLLVGVIPLHGDFDDNAVLLGERVKNIRMQHVLAAVDILHEPLHSSGKGEFLLFPGTLVDQADGQAAVEKRELAQPLREYFIVKFNLSENLPARQKVHFRSPLSALADYLERRYSVPTPKLHLMKTAVAVDRET